LFFSNPFFGIANQQKTRMSVVVVIVLVWAQVALADHRQFHCDIIHHLAQKKVWTHHLMDFLGGNTHLRLATVGVPEDDIRAAFRCDCTRQPFDPQHRQPFAPSVLRATWVCALAGSDQHRIHVAEFSHPSSWGVAQKEEFRARVTARAPWDQPLAEAGWLSRQLGWHFDSWSEEISPSLRIFALLVRGFDPESFNQYHTRLVPLRKYVWNAGSYPPVKDVRDALMRTARDALEDRAYRRGRNDQRLEDADAFERGRRQGRLECPAQNVVPQQPSKSKTKSTGTAEQSKAWEKGYQACWNEQPDASPTCPPCPPCPSAPPLYEIG
jgi:hypothetical protein